MSNTDSTPSWLVIENALEEIITTKEAKICGEDMEWAKDFYGWDIKKFKRIAYNLLRGKADGIRNNYKVSYKRMRFINDELESGLLNYIEI